MEPELYIVSRSSDRSQGLTVDWSGANPIIYATTTGSKLVKFADTGAGSTFTILQLQPRTQPSVELHSLLLHW